jgi:hypothetical protein
MYIGLWTRLESFARDDLTRALQRRSVVQATLMRTTIHLVSAGDYWPFALATRTACRESWLRSTTCRRASWRALRVACAPRMAGGPLRRADVEALLGKEQARGVGGWIDLVRAPPSGTWERRRADLWALAEDWLGPPEHDRARGRRAARPGATSARSAPRRATTSPTGPACPCPSSRRWSPAWRRAASAAWDGAQLVDRPRAPLPDPQTPAPVRFLPWWDATLLVHARSGVPGLSSDTPRPEVCPKLV